MDTARRSGRLVAGLAFLSVAALVTSMAGCSFDGTAGSGGRLRVVTTVSPITSIAANVIGGKAEITGLVPEGANSHTFEPPPSASAVLAKADVVFINGLKLEDPTRKLAEQNKKDGAEVVELGTRVLPESEWIYDFSFPKEEGKPNPHLWTDPRYAIRYAAVVRDTMVARDPANKAAYQANYTSFEQNASALGAAIRSDQRTISGGKRELLTYHDAYAYFARDYGWRVIGAIQPRNFEDPTPREVGALIDQIRREKVPTIFGSEVFPSKVLAEVGRETGARYEDTLRDDDLPGKPGDAEHSWRGLMRYDYRTMISGLGGTTKALDALEVRDVAPDTATYPQ
jgi:ABC-type Zn uptake system ZnuABC Zn-binding protein ZnuA